MNPLKPYQLIASRYQISQESAKYFLGRVQKSFKRERPPHALILEFIEAKGIDTQPEPYDVAFLMHESGIWRSSENRSGAASPSVPPTRVLSSCSTVPLATA
jgi:hypothetical protein